LTKKNLCGALGAADPVLSQPGAPVPGQPRAKVRPVTSKRGRARTKQNGQAARPGRSLHRAPV